MRACIFSDHRGESNWTKLLDSYDKGADSSTAIFSDDFVSSNEVRNSPALRVIREIESRLSPAFQRARDEAISKQQGNEIQVHYAALASLAKTSEYGNEARTFLKEFATRVLGFGGEHVDRFSDEVINHTEEFTRKATERFSKLSNTVKNRILQGTPIATLKFSRDDVCEFAQKV